MLELLDEASLREAQDLLGVRADAAGSFVVAQTDGFGAPRRSRCRRAGVP
ncbi:hypothetical protein [Nocardia sp. BMG51109]|nr:hypothetical protein [Nocardia sp. BMG51109]